MQIAPVFDLAEFRETITKKISDYNKTVSEIKKALEEQRTEIQDDTFFITETSRQLLQQDIIGEISARVNGWNLLLGHAMENTQHE